MRRNQLKQTVGDPTVYLFEGTAAKNPKAASTTAEKTRKPVFQEPPQPVDPAAEQPVQATQPKASTKKPVFQAPPQAVPDKDPVQRSVKDQVTDWMQDWEERNHRYLEEYNTRYGSRNRDLTDAYVGDAQEYLDSVNQKNQTFATEAKAIQELMNRNSSELDPVWTTAINKALEENLAKQETVRQTAAWDAEYWAQFKPNGEQAAAGYTAEQLYTAWQAEQRQYAEDLALDISAAKAELKALEQEIEDLDAYYDFAQDTLLDYVGDYKAYEAKKAALYGKYGGNVEGLAAYMEEKKKQIREKEQQIERAEYVQGYKRYMDYKNEKDYAANSQYVSTRTNVAMEDAEYKYNKPTWGGETLTYYLYDDKKLFGDFLYDYINGNQDARTAGDVYESAHGERYKFYKTMSKDEIGVFNYLYKNQGKEAANDYLGYIESNLKGRERAQEQARWAAYAKEDPVGSSIFSVLMKPAQGMDYLGQALDMLTTGKIDQNAEYNRTSRMISAIRSQVSTTIEQSGKWGKVGSFAYNTGMSMADFLFTTAISGGNQGLSLAIMGTGAAADATLAAKDRGLSDKQAFTLGTIAGLAEVAMEKVSLGAWLNGNMTDSAFRYIWKNALSEGLEEAGTSVINLLADIIIAKDKSEWNVAMQEHIKQGKSEEEAFGLVLAEEAAKIGLDTIGGILSGGTIGGGTSVAVNSYNTITGNNKVVAQNAPVTVDTKAISKPIGEYSTEKQSVLRAYLAAVDDNIKNFVQRVKEGDLTFKRQKISDVSERAAADIGELLNIDVSGYTHNINTNGVQHIINRHGESGKQDTSMAVEDDIARIGWVLDNYDRVDLLTEKGKQIHSSEFLDRNHKPAPQIRFIKRIDGTYYVVESVFENGHKKLWVQSAYLQKNEDVTQTPAEGMTTNHETNAQSASAYPSSNNSISENGQIVNAADGAANRGRKVGWDGRVAVTEAKGPNITIDGVTYRLLGLDENGSKVYQDAEVLKEQNKQEAEKTSENQEKTSEADTETEQQGNPEWFSAAVDSAKEASADSRDNLTSVAKGHIMDLQRGFMCFPEGDPLIENSQKVAPKDGFFDVAMHGEPTAVAFGGKESNMSPRLLAEVIRHNPNYHGENIRLLSCSTGLQVDGGYCFAEELANALGVTVEAPNMKVYIDVNGNIKVGKYGEGQMIPYEPNKRRRIK